MNRTVGAPLSAEYLVGAIGEHFVAVHVVRSARACLIDIHDEMLAVFAGQHLVCRLHNCIGQSRLEPARLLVSERCGAFDVHRRVNERRQRTQSADRKVLHCAECLHAVQSVPRNVEGAERILFASCLLAHGCFGLTPDDAGSAVEERIRQPLLGDRCLHPMTGINHSLGSES